MKAVIFAAALFAGASGWLLLEADRADETANVHAAVTQESSESLRGRYRTEAAACSLLDSTERSACRKKARDSVLGTLRRDAARVSALN